MFNKNHEYLVPSFVHQHQTMGHALWDSGAGVKTQVTMTLVGDVAAGNKRREEGYTMSGGGREDTRG